MAIVHLDQRGPGELKKRLFTYIVANIKNIYICILFMFTNEKTFRVF